MAIASSITAAIIAGAAAGGSGIAASRAQSGAARRASATQERGNADMLTFEREREATRRAEYDREQREARERWDAEQRHQGEVFAATEEERLFNRRLIEEREARQAPYRAASAQALTRLGDLIGLNGQPAPNAWLSPSNAGRRQPPRTMGDALNLPGRT